MKEQGAERERERERRESWRERERERERERKREREREREKRPPFWGENGLEQLSRHSCSDRRAVLHD